MLGEKVWVVMLLPDFADVAAWAVTVRRVAPRPASIPMKAAGPGWRQRRAPQRCVMKGMPGELCGFPPLRQRKRSHGLGHGASAEVHKTHFRRSQAFLPGTIPRRRRAGGFRGGISAGAG